MATVDIVHGELVSILDPPRYVPSRVKKQKLGNIQTVGRE